MRRVAGQEHDRDMRLVAVADHLGEAYRISWRVIRNRCDAAQACGYPVSGRRPVTIELRDETRPLLDSFLDDWRGLLASIPAGAQARGSSAPVPARPVGPYVASHVWPQLPEPGRLKPASISEELP
jgi:hypothetical protein